MYQWNAARTNCGGQAHVAVSAGDIFPTGAMTLMMSTNAQMNRAKTKKAMKTLSRGALLRGTKERGGGCIAENCCSIVIE
jgi:hypothetical protein